MPSKPKTLTTPLEIHITEAQAALLLLTQVESLLPMSTYRAAQRNILRKLVHKVRAEAE